MQQAESDQPSTFTTVDTFKRLVWWCDRIFMVCVAVPIALVLQMYVGGVQGLVVGFAVAFSAWLVYAGARTALMILGVRWYGRVGLDQEVIRICDEAHYDEDYQRAIAELQDLIAREGESFDRLLALAEFLRKENQVDRAMEVIHRARAVAGAGDLWRAELVSAECLLDTGDGEKARESTSRIVKQMPTSFNANLTHAKALAAIGDTAEALTHLEQARRISRMLSVRLVTGRTYVAMMQRDLDEAQERVMASTLPH